MCSDKELLNNQGIKEMCFGRKFMLPETKLNGKT